MFDEFGINAGFVEDLHAQYRQAPHSVDEEWRMFFDAFERGERAPAPGSQGNGASANGTYANGEARHAPGGNGSGNGNGALAQSPFAAPPLPRIDGVPSQRNGTSYGVVPTAADSQAAGQLGTSRDERLLAAAALQGRVYQLVNAYRVRGHLFAKIDPLGTPPEAAPELELSNFGLTEADLDVTFPTVDMAGLPERATLREIIAHLSRDLLPLDRRRVHAHRGARGTRTWLQKRMESTQQPRLARPRRRRCASSRS